MTQEEKLEEAKRLYETANADQKYVLESLFPELKESEDEKAIRDIKVVLESSATKFFKEEGKMPIWYDRAVAWLEKQGEQKPADKTKKCMYSKDDYTDEDRLVLCDGCDEICELKQKPAWSEEDEAGLGDALWAIQRARAIAKDENDMGNLWYAERWLKSLKDRVQPQNTWKPSDEQMHYLSWIANIKLGDSVVEQEVSKRLNELFEDLKKLK